jgi:hypothetical protein
MLDVAAWDPVNLVRTSLNHPFTFQLQIRRQGTLVSISIPAIQFNLAVDGQFVPGFLYTVPGTNLPKDLWPAQLLGESFVVPGQQDGLTYGLTIGTDGALTWGAPDAGIISPMPANDGHRIAPTTVTYLIPICIARPPKNIQFSTNSSNVIGSTVLADFTSEYLDYYANDIRKDAITGKIRAAFCWSENSGPLPRQFLNLMVKTALVNEVTGQATYGPAVQVNKTFLNHNYAEAKVAINPTNVNNLFVAVTLFPSHNNTAVMGFSSFDGGFTWSAAIDLFPSVDWSGDPWVIFDTFGNLYVSAITFPVYPGPGNIFPGPGSIRILASIDGGLSFLPNPIANIPSSDIAGGGFLDFSKISVGPDGTGSGNLAVWFCGDDANFTLSKIIPTIGFVPVMGLGLFGTPVVYNSFTEIPSGAAGIGLSEILVNPSTGAVYFFSTNVNDYSGIPNSLGDAALMSMWVNPTGTVGFGETSFLPRRDIMISNMNILSDAFITSRPLPWTPVRGVGNKGTMIAGYDIERHRLYFISLDMRPNLSNKDVIVVAWSENEGQTWSNQWVVNENQDVSAAIPTIAVEPTTGLVAAGFYSPVNDPINQEFVDYLGFVTKPPKISGGSETNVEISNQLTQLSLSQIAKEKSQTKVVRKSKFLR